MLDHRWSIIDRWPVLASLECRRKYGARRGIPVAQTPAGPRVRERAVLPDLVYGGRAVGRRPAAAMKKEDPSHDADDAMDPSGARVGPSPRYESPSEVRGFRMSPNGTALGVGGPVPGKRNDP